MKTWFTSDLHFDHQNAALKHRGFSSVQEMNGLIISNWNQVVSDEDVVWVLGDVAMGTIAESLDLIHLLKGRKILVPGNHDRCSSVYHEEHKTPEKRERWRIWEEAYLEAGFESIIHAHLEHNRYFQAEMPSGMTVALSHFPVIGDHTDEERYLAHRPVLGLDKEFETDTKIWNIHGHVHDAWLVRDRMINVGVDQWDFFPVEWEQIEEIIFAVDYTRNGSKR